MAETADSVAVELEGRFDKFKAASKGAADSFDNDVERIKKGAGVAENAVVQANEKMYNAFGNTGARSRQLGIQIGQLGSSLASGMNPMVVLSQQASDFAYVLGGTGGVAGRVATFFSGPWGAALLAASLVVGILTQKLLAHKDTEETVEKALEKRRKQTELNRLTDEAWGRTIDGLIEKNMKLAEELRKRLTVQNAVDRQALAGQQANVDNAFTAEQKAYASGDPAAIAKASRLYSIEVAKMRDLQLLVGQQIAAGMVDMNTRAQQFGETLGQVVQTIMGYHPELLQFSADLQGATAAVSLAATHAGAAGLNFDSTTRQTDALNKQLLHGKINVTTYTTEIRKLAAALEAAAEAAKKAGGEVTVGFQRPVTGGTITGNVGEQRPGHVHQGVDIAVPVGTQVRAAAPGTVTIETGTLPGFGNVVVIDHGHGVISRYAHLSRIGVTPGTIVEAGQPIGLSGGARGAPGAGNSQGPHLHYEVRQGGKAVNPFGSFAIDQMASEQKAAEIQAKLQREADAAAMREQAFNAELAQLEKGILGATRDRLASVTVQVTQQHQDVEIERDNSETAYRSALTAHRIDETQFKLLVEKNNQLATAKHERITTEAARQQVDVSMQLNAQYQQFQIDELHHEQAMAKTAGERRDVALRLLTAEQALERISLQRILDTTAAGSAEHQIAQMKMDELNRARQRKTEEINNDPSNLSPGQEYAKSLNQTAGQIDEAMERITVGGLEKLNDELTSAIMGTESLGEAFDNVANQIIAALIKIAIQQAIIRPLADLLFGAGAGGAGGSGGGLVPMGSTGGGWLGQLGAFLGQIFTHRAGGGPVTAGGAYWVGENGPEPFFPSTSGTVMPNQDAARMLGGGSAAQPISVALTVNAPGATAETVAMIRRELAAAAPTLVAAAQRATVNTLSRTRT